MDDFYQKAREINDAEELAAHYLQHYFEGREIKYPINPFQMLVDEGIFFAFRDFNKLEGVYVPTENEEDTHFVGININRPITRQRYTAAHELCHFIKDSQKQFCLKSSRSEVERFADRFAAGILMPLDELLNQVECRAKNGYVDFDGILEIADYFGVSFESCIFRVAYRIHSVQGDTDSTELKKRIREYKPDSQRQLRKFNSVLLYEGLIDSYGYALRFAPNVFALNIFENEYIYNDSRMENVDVNIETASEIVTDLRLSQQSSKYCLEENEAFLSIAGHAAMYAEILKTPTKGSWSVFETLKLHRELFSCFPHPEFGGKLRDTNTLVIAGAKFETIDYENIPQEMQKIDKEVKSLFEHLMDLSISSYMKTVIRLHHRLTVIHPFADGNGRTLRGFLNALLIWNGLTPVYIRIEDKKEYLKALAAADEGEDYSLLYECFFKAILRTNMDLTGSK